MLLLLLLVIIIKIIIIITLTITTTTTIIIEQQCQQHLETWYRWNVVGGGNLHRFVQGSPISRYKGLQIPVG